MSLKTSDTGRVRQRVGQQPHATIASTVRGQAVVAGSQFGVGGAGDGCHAFAIIGDARCAEDGVHFYRQLQSRRGR